MNKIITLCGSTKFKDEILDIARKLTLQGKVVLLPLVFNHSDNLQLIEEQMHKLDELHKLKINMADEILVVDVNGYIGPSTKADIDYANSLSKPIKYYSMEKLIWT